MASARKRVLVTSVRQGLYYIMLPRAALAASLLLAILPCPAGEPLPATQPLTAEGDLSVQMVEGIDRWLMRETEQVAKARHRDWRNENAVARARALLQQQLGMADAVATGGVAEWPTVLGKSSGAREFTVKLMRWPVFDDVWGQGLLYEPKAAPKFHVILINDPSREAGSPSIAAEKFAAQGCAVLVPLLVGRDTKMSGSPQLGRQTTVSHREWIYRQAFEAGRTLTGYETQSVLAAIPYFAGNKSQLGICGHGEGALIAMCAAALSPRFEAVLVSGHFGPRERLWEEPIYRNMFGFLRDFGDAELAAMSAANMYVVEHSAPPKLPVVAKRGVEAPGMLVPRTSEEVLAEVKQACALLPNRSGGAGVRLVTGPNGAEAEPGSDEALRSFFASFGEQWSPVKSSTVWNEFASGPGLDEHRLVRELTAHTQAVLHDSARIRKKLPLWAKLKPGAEWEAVQKQARADFWENVIGKLPTDYSPANPRTRLIHDKEKWRGYEVMLDVHPDIFAWGTLLVPKDLKPGERRPVVVCQHGLEGLPQDTINDDPKSKAYGPYKAFAARLADRGFIVYAPHNPYRGQDKFRMLQRKANPLGLSLFSFINAQHDVTTKWLASLPFVDPERIAFYGLSYGGKTAMRVPAVIERYCLSICSGDFNEWVMKCASNTHAAGYVFTGEWEIWEWDLAHTFNYAEMALLIAPRPFMVERGHDDGVGFDEDVGYEFGKVKRGYDKLGIGDRTEIEWFDGPHTINGVGTFKFLHKWLRWPEPK